MRYFNFSSSSCMLCYDVLDNEQFKTDEVLFVIHCSKMDTDQNLVCFTFWIKLLSQVRMSIYMKKHKDQEISLNML
jgi:hypothetical protein